jgi:hypothetical protein
MLKNVIAPIQAWLLGRGQCVGCGTPLDKGTKVKKDQNSSKITCKCRRALFSEV